MTFKEFLEGKFWGEGNIKDQFPENWIEWYQELYENDDRLFELAEEWRFQENKKIITDCYLKLTEK